MQKMFFKGGLSQGVSGLRIGSLWYELPCKFECALKTYQDNLNHSDEDDA